MTSLLASALAQTAATDGDFVRPAIDYHAFAPELVLAGVFVVVILVDLLVDERGRWALPSLAGIGLLGALIPIVTLAVDGVPRSMFGGAYVVDDFALVMKALFLISGYIVIQLSTNYVAEGDYHEGEYYTLLIAAIFGMAVMASSRDLISIFIALETLSIPGYMLAAWRKGDPRGNEAGLKYYLMGVFASAVMLYGMSLIYGKTGTTLLADIGERLPDEPVVILGILFALIGFAFKVSAVPFHTWAPDTYEGAPTPIAAFLAVASKAAGFVALIALIYVGFRGRTDVVEPLMWILAVASMTVGNLIALRQTNVVRMLAYSSVAQAGFMLAPLAVVGSAPDEALTAVVSYLLIYAAMNLGAFTVVIAVARKTRSAEISSFAGLFEYAPGLTVAMTIFLFSLAGIPPLGGWIAKFVVFRALLSAESVAGTTLAVIVAVNSVIALYYYANVARQMWMEPVADDDRTPIPVPFALASALVITTAAVILFGVYPQVITQFGEVGDSFLSAAG